MASATQVTQFLAEILTVSGVPPASGPTRVTQLLAEVLTVSGLQHSGGPTRATQLLAEVLTVSGTPPPGGPTRATQLLAEVLTVSAGIAPLTARLLWSVSGTSGVANVVIRAGTTVSGSWSVSGGAGHLYSWAFADLHGQSGFVSTAATSAIVRTYSVAGGQLGTRGVSSTVTASGFGTSSVTSAVLLHVTGIKVPNQLDGVFQRESQRARRTWPL